MSETIIQSLPNVWQPVNNAEAKLLEPGCEVSAFSLKAGGGPAHVSFYDCRDANGATPNALKWTLDASTADVDNQSFTSPLVFKNGLFAVLDQGGNLGVEVCFAVIKYASNY